MQLSAPADGPKRILAIEGGGVRGMFSLQILERMEHLLREHYRRPDMVLADHFHLIAGTSVGAILAAFLSWGWSVQKLQALFDQSLHRIFSRAVWWKLGGAAFRRGPLREILQAEFKEAAGEPAHFGTERLKTWLLVVVRNLSTGGTWPLLNHPDMRYNHETRGGVSAASNLHIPLWQVVRGSTAAPWYFPPERVTVAPGRVAEFIDGGVTAYNNPSVIAWLMATLPCYPLQWERGLDKLHVVSVGTGRVRALISPAERWRFGRLSLAGKVPASLIEAASHEQDLLMRTMGRCEHGPEMDREMGTLAGDKAVGDAFRYVRFNKDFTGEAIRKACAECSTRFSLSAVKLAPWLKREGRVYAEESVKTALLV